jgi:hypothetical protein
MNSRAGILFNTNKLYLGYTVNVLRRIISNGQFNPTNAKGMGWFESYLQAGYTFQKNSDAKFSFTPQLVISIEKYPYSSQINVGLQAYNVNFRYKQFIWGVNNRGLHLGWQTDQLRVMVTNSIGDGINSVKYNSIGFGTDRVRYSGTISFRYILGSKNQKSGRGW